MRRHMSSGGTLGKTEAVPEAGVGQFSKPRFSKLGTRYPELDFGTEQYLLHSPMKQWHNRQEAALD